MYQNLIRGNPPSIFPISLPSHIGSLAPTGLLNTIQASEGHSCPARRELVSSQSRRWQASYQPSLASVLDWTWTPAPGRPFTILVSQGFLIFSVPLSAMPQFLSSLRLFTSSCSHYRNWLCSYPSFWRMVPGSCPSLRSGLSQ